MEVLPFAVVSATSEDAAYPARGLAGDAGGRGWVSGGSGAAAEVILRLVFSSSSSSSSISSSGAELVQLQVLSHESKVASKVEVFVAPPLGLGETEEALRFSSLGYFAFDDNSRNRFMARELKAVFARARDVGFVKLKIRGVHPNPALNPLNQAGIVAVNLIGYPPEKQQQISKKAVVSETAPSSLRTTLIERSSVFKVSAQDHQTLESKVWAHNEAIDKNLTDYIPSDLAHRLNEIRVSKERAVANELYEEAERLRETQIALEQAVQKLITLENAKRQAVSNEDYLRAKEIKTEIQRVILEATEQSQRKLSGSKSPPSLQPQQRPRRVPDFSAARVHNSQSESFSPQIRRTQPDNASQHLQEGSPQRERFEEVPAFSLNNNNSNRVEDDIFSKNESPFLRERQISPAETGAAAAAASASVDEVPIVSQQKQQSVSPAPIEGYWNGVPGIPSETDRISPELLPPEMMNEAKSIISAFDEYIARCLYSKEVKLRVAAIRKIEYQLEREEILSMNEKKVKIALAAILHMAFTDNIPQVNSAGLHLFDAQVAKSPELALSVGTMVSPGSSAQVIDKLVDLLGNVDSKIRTLTSTSLATMISVEAIKQNALEVVLKSSLRPWRSANRSTLWAPLHARLVLFLDLLKRSNFFSSFSSSTDDVVGRILDWLSHGNVFSHPNQQIRDTVKEMLLLFCNKCGRKVVQSHLEQADLKPRVMEEYEKALRQATNQNSSAKAASAAADSVAKPVSRGNTTTPHTETREKRKEFVRADYDDNDDVYREKEEEQDEEEARWNDRSKKNFQGMEKQTLEKDTFQEGREEGKEYGDEDEDDAHDDICHFCGIRDEARFANEDGLLLHYFQECPMLTVCPQCRQVVEVATLNEHLLDECDMKMNHRKCPRCNEAIAALYFEQHVKRGTCLQAKPLTDCSRCPLCHTDIPPGEEGWRDHLMNRRCDKNPRF